MLITEHRISSLHVEVNERQGEKAGVNMSWRAAVPGRRSTDDVLSVQFSVFTDTGHGVLEDILGAWRSSSQLNAVLYFKHSSISEE